MTFSGDLGAGETFDSFTRKVGRELTPKQAQRVTDLVPKNMILFQFDAGIFTAGQVSETKHSRDHDE